MRLYLDTSLVVSTFANEPATARVREWLANRASDELLTSAWVATEFSAAAAMKFRLGYIDGDGRALILGSFAKLYEKSLTVIPISSSDFRTAAGFADIAATGLRAGDALHMAICHRAQALLCTLDIRFAEAGPLCGVDTLLV